MPSGVYLRTEKHTEQLKKRLHKFGLLKTKFKLTKEEVHKLYYGEEKTAGEVAELGGVTRQRVVQLMEEWDFKRREEGRRMGRPLFKGLDGYFEHCRRTGNQNRTTLRKYFKPHMKECERCGRTEHLYFKVLEELALSVKDIQVLCSACLFAFCPGRKGLDGLKQAEICSKFIRGVDTGALGKEYGVGRSRIYQVLREGGVRREERIILHFNPADKEKLEKIKGELEEKHKREFSWTEVFLELMGTKWSKGD